MDGINGSTPASGTDDCIKPPPATNVPQGSPDLAVGIVVDVEASPSEEKEQSDEKEQKASKALEHNQVKPEDESPHKPEAILMVKKDINYRDNATSSSQHAAGSVFNLWPNHVPIKSPPVPLTDAEIALQIKEGLRDFRKGESARRKYRKEREEAALKLIASRFKS